MADDLEVVVRPFQLDPTAPLIESTPVALAYAKKFGGPEKAEAILRHVTDVAAADGITFNMDIALRANTLAAHRLLAYVESHHGAQAQMDVNEAIMNAYFRDGRDIADFRVLADCATAAGCEPQDVIEMLESDAYRDEIAEWLAVAAENGITAVPTFIIDDRWSIPGAQDSEMFERVLRRMLTQAS
ncbi:MAG: DsbA family oxidoreductase [Actinobacteria bacterium]|nr:DsbA family oxidoreductase [Actinomycetota bacterium]